MSKVHFRWRNGHWRLIDKHGFVSGQRAVIRKCLHCGVDYIGHQFRMLCSACQPRHQAAGYRAAQVVARAIRAGRLQPPNLSSCVDCGEPAVFYDHRDYSKPLAVEPVCRRCNNLRGPARHELRPDIYPADEYRAA